ncbi:MAG: hypothetical protein ACRD1K_02585 [Acidimicrobiales bacterium]
MRSAYSNRVRALVAAVAVTALAACGGDGDDDRGSTNTTGASNTTTSVMSGTAPPLTQPTMSTSARSTGTTGTTGTTTTTTTTTAAAATTVTTGPVGGDGSGAAGQATAAGRYTYETTGTFTSPLGRSARNGDSVLAVDPPAGDQQRSVRVGPGRTVEQVLQLLGGGTYLVSLKITDGGFAQEVRPASPVLAVPSPAPVGREWSWQAPTADGRSTVSSSFRVARTESIPVGGEAVPTSVVEATILTTGEVASTGRQTFWYSERHRLIVQMQETTDGRVAGISFGSQSTDRLRSLRPA